MQSLPMAFSAAPSVADPAASSHATHCSLRRADRETVFHPLKQNPPSFVSAAEPADFYDVDIDIGGPRRPSPAFASAATHYDPDESPLPLQSYPSRVASGHQRSLTSSFLDNCQPFINRATTTLQQHTSRASLHSPSKSLASFIPSRSAIETSATASQPKLRVLQNWFNGSSAPVNLGVPAAEDEESESGEDYDFEDEDDEAPTMMSGIFNRGGTLTGTASADTTPTKHIAPAAPQMQAQTQMRAHTPTPSNRFSWLLSPQKSTTPPATAKYHNPDDELLKLNISQILFPHGPVDPLAPSSFHDLLSAAESLLTRYQSSYRQLSTALSDARLEQSAQADELDESETRVRHLKMQLDAMTTRASEQDAQMQRLAEDLELERRARHDDECARKQSLAIIRDEQAAAAAAEGAQRPRHRRNRMSHSEAVETHSMHRRNRMSNASSCADSSDFDSECDSEEAGSVFSRSNCLSPTNTVPSSAASIAEDHDVTPNGKRRPVQMTRRSTYDRVRDGSINMDLQGSAGAGWGCRNCEGGAQADVWAKLAREKEESRALKQRVEVLECAVEGALNVVDGPWGF